MPLRGGLARAAERAVQRAGHGLPQRMLAPRPLRAGASYLPYISLYLPYICPVSPLYLAP